MKVKHQYTLTFESDLPEHTVLAAVQTIASSRIAVTRVTTESSSTEYPPAKINGSIMAGNVSGPTRGEIIHAARHGGPLAAARPSRADMLPGTKLIFKKNGNSTVIDIDASLKNLGLTREEVMNHQWLPRSDQNRLKISIIHTGKPRSKGARWATA